MSLIVGLHPVRFPLWRTIIFRDPKRGVLQIAGLADRNKMSWCTCYLTVQQQRGIVGVGDLHS